MPNLIYRRITFGGDVIPAIIGTSPHIIRATRKTTVVQIAGTSREVVEMEDAWDSYDQTYTLVVGDGTQDSIQEILSVIAEKLYKTGYQVLIDDYEPDIFRLAYYVGGFDVENRKTRVGKFDITFRCRPERFLMSGNVPVDTPTGSVITNPTSFKAKPLIHIEGSGNGTLVIQGQTITIEDMVDYLNIDCDTMDVYRQPSENRNSLMSGEFPVLYSGNNSISFTGGITAVTITPRFWTI